jgi:hypothetical protein
VNKKKQKNFNNFWPVALERPWRRGAKVFWFFFSKKNSLFLLTFLIFGRLESYQKSSKKNFESHDVPPAGGTHARSGTKSYCCFFFRKRRPFCNLPWDDTPRALRYTRLGIFTRSKPT